MQVLVLGYDGEDEGAMERRLKVRADHIAKGEELLKSGNLWYGAAMTGEDGKMVGSIYMMHFSSRDELDAYLKEEPYVVGDVWRKIEIIPCNTRDPWQFNRTKEFFEERQK